MKYLEHILYKFFTSIILIKYLEYIRYFSKNEKPKNILSDEINNEYSNREVKLPQVYQDVENEYSQINISVIDSDTISMIYWDMSFLSDEFICYCLPVLIPKSVEYKDGILLKQLKKIVLEKLPKNDAIKIEKLIKTMEKDKLFNKNIFEEGKKMNHIIMILNFLMDLL